MGTKGRILIAIMVIAVLALLARTAFQTPPPEPEYQGKTLSYWLDQLHPSTNYNQSARNAAESVIGQIGTNAIPTFLRMLEERDSDLKIMVMGLLRKQHLIKIKPSLAPANRNFDALTGFRILGSKASNAVPQLIVIFNRDHDAFPQQAVPQILGQIGPPAAPAIPTLLRGTAHTNAYVRNNSIWALGQIHAEPKLVVPRLITCLNDSEPFVRAKAAQVLGAFGKDAESAVPSLITLWQRESTSTASGPIGNFGTSVSISWKMSGFGMPAHGNNVADRASDALQAIDPAAADKAGVTPKIKMDGYY